MIRCAPNRTVCSLKHTLEECMVLWHFYSQAPPKEDAEKKQPKDKDEDNKDDGFPEVGNCFLIFGGCSTGLMTS